jgi:hypothetical protein
VACAAALPTPATDTQDARATRDEAAMAAVAALHPTDTSSAKISHLEINHLIKATQRTKSS